MCMAATKHLLAAESRNEPDVGGMAQGRGANLESGIVRMRDSNRQGG
jgi:hypothetical protein